MASLPYIIHVQGNKPFNVVHADMPFEDVELYQRIFNNNLELTNEEKKYATWAREKNTKLALKIRTKGRNEGSIPSYVGHTPVRTDNHSVPIVRYGSNTINLDMATYAFNVSLAVNHTNGCSQYIGKKNTFPVSLFARQKELNRHLKHNPYNPELYQLAKEPRTEQDAPPVKRKHHKHRLFDLNSCWRPGYERINKEDRQNTYLNRDEDDSLKLK